MAEDPDQLRENVADEFGAIASKLDQKGEKIVAPFPSPGEETRLFLDQIGKELTPRQRSLIEIEAFFQEKTLAAKRSMLETGQLGTLSPAELKEAEKLIEKLANYYWESLDRVSEWPAATLAIDDLKADLAAMKMHRQSPAITWRNIGNRVELFQLPLLLSETKDSSQEQYVASVLFQAKTHILSRLPELSFPNFDKLPDSNILTKEKKLYSYEVIPLAFPKEDVLSWRERLIPFVEKHGKPHFTGSGKAIRVEGQGVVEKLNGDAVGIWVQGNKKEVDIALSGGVLGTPHYVVLEENGTARSGTFVFDNQPETAAAVGKLKALPLSEWRNFVEKSIELAQTA